MSFRISLVFLLSYNHGTIFLARTLGILNARTESFCAPRGNALLNCPQGKTYSMACVWSAPCVAQCTSWPTWVWVTEEALPHLWVPFP